MLKKIYLPYNLYITILSLLCWSLHYHSSIACSYDQCDPNKYATLVIDALNGKILHQENANKLRYPASLTKMMTLYLTFEALTKQKLKMSDKILISSYAASQPPSKIDFKPGDYITVREAIIALIVKSANDVAVALSEKVAGREEKFAALMTKRARDLGMSHTVFRNASGLPDPMQQTTAYDMAKLAMAIRRDFPQYYYLFRKTSFNYKGRVYNTSNKVVKAYEWADGLKTGYINDSGFNLVTSARKGNKRLIAVVLGGKTANMRDMQMIALLNRHLGIHTPSITQLSNNNITKNKINKKSISKKSNNIKLAQSKISKNRKQVINKSNQKKMYDLAQQMKKNKKTALGG